MEKEKKHMVIFLNIKMNFLKQANETLINKNFKLYKQVKDLIKENNELKGKLQKS